VSIVNEESGTGKFNMPEPDLDNKSHFGAWGHDTLIVKQIRLETVGAKTIQVQHAIGCWTLANQKK
jgi:hypothetical protein